MTEHLKAIPDQERGLIIVEMDQEAFNLWKDHENESAPLPRVNQHTYRMRRDRIIGLFFAVASQMGWWKK